MRAHLHPLAFLAGLAAVALSGVSTAAAQPAPSGPLFRVDPDVPRFYQDLAVAAGPGGFAVAWAESSWDGVGDISFTLRARRFDATGGRLGPAVTLAVSPESDVDVAVGRTGEALAAWIAAGIHVRRLDSTGRPLGRTRLLDADFLVDSPRVVAHPDGGFLVAWEKLKEVAVQRVFANGVLSPQILVSIHGQGCRGNFHLSVGRRGDVALACNTSLRILDPDLKPRGSAVPVPIPAPWRLYANNLAVEFGTGDDLIAVWGAYSPDNNRTSIFARRYDLKRGWIGSLLKVTPQGDAVNLAVAADPAGGLLAIWFNFDTFELRGRRIEPSGQLGPDFPLDPEGLSERWGNLKAVAALEAGSFVTVWDGTYGILGQRFASGSPGQLELRRDLSVAAEAEGQVLLDVVRREGNHGEVHVSWSALGQDATPGEDFEATSGTVTFADGDSQPKRIAIPLHDDGRPEGDESFQVVLQDPEGGATLGPRTAARAEIRDDDVPSPLLTNAGPVIQAGEIGPVDAFGASCCLDLVRLSTGGLAAAWQRGYESRSVELALFDAAGQPAGAGQASGPPPQSAPQLLPQPGGGFILIWRSDYDFGPESKGWFAQRFDAGGEPLSQQVPLESFRSMEALHVAPAPGGGFFALGSRREGTRVNLFVERYGMDCRRVGEPIQINERPLLDPSTFLELEQLGIAASPSGAFLAVWQRRPLPGRPGGVFARLVSASGSPLGNEITIAGAAHIVFRLTVAAAPDGGFVVAWESGRDGSGWGISARWLDASGLLLGAEMTVNSTAIGNQTRPRAAFDSDGGLLMTWRSAAGIRGQLFDGPGHREGSEFRIDTAPDLIPTEPVPEATSPGTWSVLWRWFTGDFTQEGFSLRRLAPAHEAGGPL
jgi:hypothetical protein